MVATVLMPLAVFANEPAKPIAATDDLEPAVSFDAAGGGLSTAAESEPAVTQAGNAEPAPSATSTLARNSAAMDRLDLDSTVITGNQELPKVLYIVPWKKAELGELPGRPVNSLVNEILEPVDRDEFRRRIDYYDTLFGTQVTDSSGSDE
jgi:hypothetical protein